MLDLRVVDRSVVVARVRILRGEFANAGVPRLHPRVDQIDGGAVFAHGLDLDPRRARRHDDDTRFAQQLAGASEGLSEIAGGRGDKAPLGDPADDVVCGTELETARDLEGFRGEGERHAESGGKPGRLDDRGGTNDITQRFEWVVRPVHESSRRP